MLNATSNYTPAPLDSGVGRKITDPPQVMSPNMEGPPTEADARPSSGSISQIASQVKDEPQSRANYDPVMETKPDSSSPTLEVKVEQKESESKEENTASVKQEERTPEPDSEDSFTPEKVIEEVHRFLDTRGPRVSAHATRSRKGSNSATNNSQRKSACPRRFKRTRLWSLCFARSKTGERKMLLAGSVLV